MSLRSTQATETISPSSKKKKKKPCMVAHPFNAACRWKAALYEFDSPVLGYNNKTLPQKIESREKGERRKRGRGAGREEGRQQAFL